MNYEPSICLNPLTYLNSNRKRNMFWESIRKECKPPHDERNTFSTQSKKSGKTLLFGVKAC